MWPEVHHMLISVPAETLTSQLLPQYRVAIDQRVYAVSGADALLVEIPDVTIDERRRQRPIVQPTGTGTAVLSSAPIKVQVNIKI